MKHKKFLSLLLLFICGSLLAQNQITLGLRSEIGLNQISAGEKKENDFQLLPIRNLSLTIDVNLFNNFSFQFRPGFNLSKNYYEGFELGGYLNYKIPNSKFYFQLGINYHFNSSVDGNSGGVGETISLVGFGIGYKISDRVSLDISYHHPLENFYGSFGYPENNLHKSYSIERTIELGFGFRIN